MIGNIIVLSIAASLLILPILGAYVSIKEVLSQHNNKDGEQWRKDNPDANILRGHGGRGY